MVKRWNSLKSPPSEYQKKLIFLDSVKIHLPTILADPSAPFKNPASYPLNSFHTTTMKLPTLLGLIAALSSALDIRVTISIDEDLSVSESFNQGSGTCRMYLSLARTSHSLTLSRKDGIGPLLDKRISSIAPDSGVICTLFE